jgi:RNA polymerase sigma factor (sigma-70 family)
MMATATVTLPGVRFMDDAVVPRPRPLESATGVPAEADVESTQNLVIRARSGDQAALDDLFARYETRLRRWAHGRLPASARGALDTRDLVQDTLFKVFQKLPVFEPRHPGAFRDYVWTTLWNSIRDIARTQQRRGFSDPLASDLPGSLPSPFEEAMGSEVFARYESAMERLRPEEREAIIARIEMGLSHAEVAAALGKPTVAAAHMTVSRALVRLAEEMAHDRRSKR